MTAKGKNKISPRQVALLTAIAAGENVYRSERIHELYRWFWVQKNDKVSVTTTIQRLFVEGFIRIGSIGSLETRVEVTRKGSAFLESRKALG